MRKDDRGQLFIAVPRLPLDLPQGGDLGLAPRNSSRRDDTHYWRRAPDQKMSDFLWLVVRLLVDHFSTFCKSITLAVIILSNWRLIKIGVSERKALIFLAILASLGRPGRVGHPHGVLEP